MKPIVAPYVGMAAKSQRQLNYEDCDWKGGNMSLLEFLRKTNDIVKVEPLDFIKMAHKQRLKAAEAEPKSLKAFTRSFAKAGQKLVAADMVWRLKDTFYGQWLSARAVHAARGSERLGRSKAKSRRGSTTWQCA